MPNTLRAVALALLIASWFNLAQAAEPLLRIVVPSTAGGSLDVVARTIGSYLATYRKHPVIVENKPGADSAIASEYTIQAKPAGSTLLVSSSFLALGAAQGKFRFDPLRDLEPVIKLSRQDVILVSRATLPAPNLEALVQHTGSGHAISCGGSIGQMALACEQLRTHLGEQHVVPITYNSMAQQVTALMGNHLDIGFANTLQVLQPIEVGKLRALATVGSVIPKASLMNLPDIAQRWPDLGFEAYMGLYVAAGASPAQIDALNADLNAILQEPDVLAFFDRNGLTPIGGPPDLLRQAYAKDMARFERIQHLLLPVEKR